MTADWLAIGEAISTGLGVTALWWIVKQLTDDKGSLAPRWSRDQEREARIAAEARNDRTLDMFEAFVAAQEKQKSGSS